MDEVKSNDKIISFQEKKASREEKKTSLDEKTITNFIAISDGKNNELIPIHILDILEKLEQVKDVIKINGILYGKNNNGLHLLKHDIDLFSHVQQIGYSVAFKNFTGSASRKEVFSALTRNEDKFKSIAITPTYPIEKGVYYDCPQIEPQITGALDELLKFFKPLDEHSKALLKALFITPAWGDGDGQRPIFVIQSDPNYKGNKQGFGKSTVPKLLARLYKKDPIHLSARMDELAAQRRIAMHKESRIILFDNVKAQNWSSEFVEMMVTAKSFMGHLMWVGDIRIRNHFTTIVTVNDPSVSADMASRAVPIYLSHPEKKDPNWEPSVEKFIDEHSDEIMADILHTIASEPKTEDSSIRFPQWERAILNKCTNDLDVKTYIKSGQSEINSEKNNWWEEPFIQELSRYASHSERDYFKKIQDVRNVSWWIASSVVQALYLKHSNTKSAVGPALGKKIKSEFAKFESWHIEDGKNSWGRGTELRGYFFEPVRQQTTTRYVVRELAEKDCYAQPEDK